MEVSSFECTVTVVFALVINGDSVPVVNLAELDNTVSNKVEVVGTCVVVEVVKVKSVDVNAETLVETEAELIIVDDCDDAKIEEEKGVLVAEDDTTDTKLVKGHHVVYTVTAPCLVTVVVDK